jgi:secondary thiamine-phosphate synthase enzyme
METLTSPAICRHAAIHVSSEHPTQFIDLTPQIERVVAASGISGGMMNIQTLHTTTGIVVNEHEPLLLADFETLLERVARADRHYHHDDRSVRTVNVTEGERPNGHAHCRALLLSASACINVKNGRLVLGRWQRIFFVELDGPRERQISMVMMGEARS